eukprot:scaffold174987_cov13-Tisochrysis_lutea.AAC.1
MACLLDVGGVTLILRIPSGPAQDIKNAASFLAGNLACPRKQVQPRFYYLSVAQPCLTATLQVH